MTMQTLPSPELLRKLLRYDPETGKLFWRERPASMFHPNGRDPNWRARNWNSRCAGKEAFTARIQAGYRTSSIWGVKHRAHIVAWAMYHDQWPEGHIDHINGDPSDNRIVNLRVVSPTQNMRNQKRSAANKSGTTGVHWLKSREKWVADIGVNRKNLRIGYFDEKQDAIKARKEAERFYNFHPNHGR